MKEMKFDKDTYLQRINYTKEVSVTIECLIALHRAQLFTIPFENFDIVLGRAIDLEPTNSSFGVQNGGNRFQVPHYSYSNCIVNASS